MFEARQAGETLEGSSMPSVFLNDPQHWRDRADQMRALASESSDPESRTIMLRVANDYDLLARRAERRAQGVAQSK
jgi:hypothetical protein